MHTRSMAFVVEGLEEVEVVGDVYPRLMALNAGIFLLRLRAGLALF